MKTIEERAKEFMGVWRKSCLLSESQFVDWLMQMLREQIEDVAQIVEQGSKLEEGLTDHIFRASHSGAICTCGLYRDKHPRRKSSRKAILRQIRALGETETDHDD